MKINTYLVRSTVVAALGGLLFGFDTAVISGTTSNLVKVYALPSWLFGLVQTLHTSEDSLLLGITVSAALIGTIIGAMFVPSCSGAKENGPSFCKSVIAPC